LEEEREKLEKGGVKVPRPPEKSGDPSDRLQKKLDAAAELKERLSGEFAPIQIRIPRNKPGNGYWRSS